MFKAEIKLFLLIYRYTEAWSKLETIYAHIIHIISKFHSSSSSSFRVISVHTDKHVLIRALFCAACNHCAVSKRVQKQIQIWQVRVYLCPVACLSVSVSISKYLLQRSVSLAATLRVCICRPAISHTHTGTHIIDMRCRCSCALYLYLFNFVFSTFLFNTYLTLISDCCSI